MIYIGMDDTDNKTSRGTGRLARAVAATLAEKFQVRGVTRHQFLVDPRIPYTSHNSSATIHVQTDDAVDLNTLADQVATLMLADFQAGSDPGLCIARDVPAEIVAFGQRAKIQVVTQTQAWEIAAQCGCILRGLGGTQDGVIGALAGVGLATTGADGRFVLVGRSREIEGVQSIPTILAHDVDQVRALDGRVLTEGMVDTNGKLRPAFREHQAILFVQPSADNPALWVPVKLD